MTLFKDFDIRLPVMLAINIGIFIMLSFLNDAATGVSVYFYCTALMIVVPALFLGVWGMTALALFMGFLFEAFTPICFGFTPVLFVLASLAIFRLREKFRSLEPVGILLLTWVVNMALYIVSVVFIFPRGIGDYGDYVTRMVVDCLFSSMLIVLIGSFIVQLHRSIFYLMGINLAIPED